MYSRASVAERFGKTCAERTAQNVPTIKNFSLPADFAESQNSIGFRGFVDTATLLLEGLQTATQIGAQAPRLTSYKTFT